jgi:hypothetical protein
LSPRATQPRRCYRLASLAAALAVSGGIAVRAQDRELAHAGLWSAYSGVAPDGRSLCGISTTGDDGRRIAIEQPTGESGLWLSLDKPSWTIPPQTPIDIAVRFDGGATIPEHGQGNGASVQVAMPFAQTVPFMRALRFDQVIEVDFPSGSEAAWHGGLAGSSRIIDAFDACRNDMARTAAVSPSPPPAASTPPAAPTQPFAVAPASSAAPPPPVSSSDLPPLPAAKSN